MYVLIMSDGTQFPMTTIDVEEYLKAQTAIVNYWSKSNGSQRQVSIRAKLPDDTSYTFSIVEPVAGGKVIQILKSMGVTK